ncbi:MAG TPA: response regulator [Actinomycetota bacterium]
MARVLVVEDEPDISMMLRVMLEMRGFEVTAAGSGEEALTSIEDNMPSVLLLDLRLPGIDGWEVIDRLRDRDLLASLPVIVVSAHASPGRQEQALAAGCYAYLTKPFRAQELVELLEGALQDGKE